MAGITARAPNPTKTPSRMPSPRRATSDKEHDAGQVMDLERALKTLPEGARHVVVLQAVYGYSHEECADMLGVAVGTCKAQLHRGRKLLRERMGLAAEADDE